MKQQEDCKDTRVRKFELRLSDMRPLLVMELARRGVPPCDRDDIVQQALLELFKRRPVLEPLPTDELKAYARRAVLFWFFKAYRTSVRRQRREQQWAGLDNAPQAGPEELLSRNQALGACLKGLRLLPEPLLTVVMVRAVEGLTTVEAADRLGLPVGTVKSRLLKARALLEAWRQ